MVFVIIFEIEEVFWVKISNGLFRMTLEMYDLCCLPVYPADR